jgi:CSLREA domain-containing protein
LALSAAPAGAATITPTTTADQFGEDSAHCALREALQAANTDGPFGGCPAGSGADLIPLAAGTYSLTRAGNDDTNDKGDLDVDGVVTISHAGVAPAIIDGAGGQDRILHLTVGESATASGVTIRNGYPVLSGTNGGAIRNSGGTLNLTNATLTGNRTDGSGGAITSFSGATTNLTNVTVSGNRADSGGGGISASSGALSLNNVTVTGNTADADASGAGNGGGITEAAATVTTRNTVISGNFDLSGDNRAKNCEGNYTTTGHTLFGSQAMFFSDCLITFTPGNGDVLDQDVALLALADNGGPTPTHALPASSSALNAGGSDCAATDQRGVPRSLGGVCDGGAYELVKCAGRVVNRVGTAGKNRLKGTSKADGILGLAGNDILRGLAGRDSLCGGKGRDKLFGGKGRDRLRGGPGRDLQRQ